MIDKDKKIKLGVIFGGRSEEHEISILSASSFISAVDKEKYKLIPIGIDKQGEWYFADPERLENLETLDDIDSDEILIDFNKIGLSELKRMVDFAFILVHGKYGEDGTLQGVFETLDIPYSGCGVAASAIAMDKVFAKMIFEQYDIPVVPYTVMTEKKENSIQKCLGKCSDLGYPLFVKPPNSGSSVGISKAENEQQLVIAVNKAFKYDTKVLIEKAITGRELETAIIGDPQSGTVTTGAIGEIVSSAEFYDYEAKYKNEDTELIVPAKFDRTQELYDMAVKAYKAIGCEGYARIDCFADSEDGNIYINEINTIPGFTRYSMFPRLFEAKGIPYSNLIDEIVGFGNERKR